MLIIRLPNTFLRSTTSSFFRATFTFSILRSTTTFSIFRPTSASFLMILGSAFLVFIFAITIPFSLTSSRIICFTSTGLTSNSNKKNVFFSCRYFIVEYSYLDRRFPLSRFRPSESYGDPVCSSY